MPLPACCIAMGAMWRSAWRPGPQTQPQRWAAVWPGMPCVSRASGASHRPGAGGGAFRRRGEGAWWPPRCCTRWWRRPRYSHGIPAHMHGAASTAAGVRHESGAYVNIGRAATGAPPPGPPGVPRGPGMRVGPERTGHHGVGRLARHRYSPCGMRASLVHHFARPDRVRTPICVLNSS